MSNGTHAARILAVLIASVVAFGFQQTAVIPAMPVIAEELHASRTWSAWLLSGYLVASSVFTPLVGKFGDRIGKRRLLMISLAVFAFGSLGAALSPNLASLVIFRAVQGVGGAVFPLTLALVRDLLPGGRVASGISMLTGGFGLGTALGFGCSGPLVALGSWRWIFAVGGCVLVLVTALVPFGLPPSRPGRTVGLDITGAVLLGGGLALLLVALTEGRPSGWVSPLVLGSATLAVLLLGGWVRVGLRKSEPLLDLRLFARRPVLLANAATVGLGFVLFGTYFLVPYLVSAPTALGGFDAGPIRTGLFLLPVAVGQLITGPAAATLARYISAPGTCALGLLLMAAGSTGLGLLRGSVAALVASALLIGAGAGLGIAVASTIVTRSAAEGETAVASALNSVLRRVGGGFGSQLAALVVAGGAVAGGAAFTLAFVVGAGVAVLSAVLAAGTATGRRR